MYRDSSRDPACHLMAYAVPSEEALAAILAVRLPVIEVGAGTGYWAAALQDRGAEVVAYDVAPAPPRGGGRGSRAAAAPAGNEYHAEIPAFTEVLQGGTESAGRHPDHALFLCYPPPKCDMAERCLRAYPGPVVLHVGEWEGKKIISPFVDCMEPVRWC